MSVRPNANLHAELNACLPLLSAYAWPGNVRELRNLMQRVALLLAVEPLQALTPALMLKLAPELQNTSTNSYTKKNQPTMQIAQRSVSVHETLQRFEGNRAAAAEHLGISRTTLWRRLKEE